ncbi:hypothetical protein ACCS78_30725, partial [Rhizobium johnstonii]
TKASSPNLFASAVNLIDAAARIGDHDAATNIRCRERISVFIWAARGRMRPQSGGHLLTVLGAQRRDASTQLSTSPNRSQSG